MINPAEIRLQDFYSKLNKRVSDYNARLVLQSAVMSSGIHREGIDQLNVDEARAICLELIKRGGPAFQVGKDIYQQLQ